MPVALGQLVVPTFVYEAPTPALPWYQPSTSPSYQPTIAPTIYRTNTFITASKNRVTSKKLAIGLIFTTAIIVAIVYFLGFDVRWTRRKKVLPLHRSKGKQNVDDESEDDENEDSEEALATERAKGGDEDEENGLEQALAPVRVASGVLSSFVTSMPSRIEELISDEEDSDSSSESESESQSECNSEESDTMHSMPHTDYRVRNNYTIQPFQAAPQSSNGYYLPNHGSGGRTPAKRKRDPTASELIEIHPEEWGIAVMNTIGRAFNELNSLAEEAIFNDSLDDESSFESGDSDFSEEEKESAIPPEELYKAIMSTLKSSTVLTKPVITLTDNWSQNDKYLDKKGQSHFSLEVIAVEFEGLSTRTRHRMICKMLGRMMKQIDSLEVKALSPSEHY